MVTAASANELHANALVKVLMRRGAERALVDSYLARLVRRNANADFLAEEQKKAFYQQAPENFKIPQCIPADLSRQVLIRQKRF